MKTSTVALYSFVLSVLKMRNLSLHSLWHTAMPIYQYSVGLVTHILSILAFYLMVTKTPSTAKPFACYLMFLQVCLFLATMIIIINLQLAITLVDFNMDFLTCLITAFPVSLYLCNGILCTWFRFSGHVGIVGSKFQ